MDTECSNLRHLLAKEIWLRRGWSVRWQGGVSRSNSLLEGRKTILIERLKALEDSRQDKRQKVNIGLVVIQKFVSEAPGLLHILSVQALAYAFFGVVGQMHRAMKPPRSVIIPQVMVRIITVQSDGQILISHFFTTYFSTKYTSGHTTDGR
jgi:hypothetical protein